MNSRIGIGLLGCGTVGGGVAELLLACRYRLRGIAVRSLSKPRPAQIPWELYTRDANAVVDDPENDLIVECIGGLTDAAQFVERALHRGKHVVTANKDLIATQGPRLHALAARSGATLQYEAAVGAGIPILRTISQSLSNEEIFEVGGVLNGTTNFILTGMHDGASYAEALQEAQRLGYAETDPSSDVNGVDAAHKLAILCQLAFRIAVTTAQIARRGLDGVERRDIEFAQSLGYTVKLLAFARNTPTGFLAAVMPACIPREHAFAAPTGVENCIRVLGKSSGSLIFSGAGAGGAPTASAVLADINAALHSIAFGRPLELSRKPLRASPAIGGGLAALGRLLRLRSFRDVRPAAAALENRAYRIRLIDPRAAIEIFPQSDLSDADILQTLRFADINPARILPLWHDALHHKAPVTTHDREKETV